MRGYAFPPTTDTSDWRAPFYVAVTGTNYVPDTGTHVVPKTPPEVGNNIVPNFPPTQKGVTTTELVTWHPPDDEIIIGMSPEAISWSDYGTHHRSYPPGRGASNAPYFQASSNDGSGYVTLVNPGLIDILIPGSVMRGFGPGEINVGIRFARASDQRTSTLIIGRLPILHGVV